MEVDSDNGLLSRVALGTPVEIDTWPGLRSDILARLEEIAHNEFPIPKLPPPQAGPRPTSEPRASPLPSSPLDQSSQEINKENAPTESLPATQPVDSGALPKQLADMLTDITTHLQTFTTCPPHTVQRLAELILQPRAHYKALATYLHAVDRVVQVTSGISTYPLPPAIPDMSSMRLNGEDAKDPALSVAWGNPTTAALGTDEALGGALLTPIPWLTRRSPEESNHDTPGAQIHSESTETIDGPNGVGSIETVSVSVNGVPSTGHARGVTQGELLRQEQRAGVVPVSQLSRAQEAVTEEERAQMAEGEDGEPQEDEETPHARGPEEIGVNDTGLQAITTSYVGEDGLEMEGIDVEAAVGRKHEEEEASAEGNAEDGNEAKSPSAESVGTKREAEQDLESEPSKKTKEDAEDGDKEKDEADADATKKKIEERGAADSAKEAASEEDGDKMDTK
ncbi:hypothetical protein G7Z17_g12819 [Cylindrodendrum hubeiense]|uniref:Protein phosphatase 4 core regulatory subunit R2 n=1 Tax=Cylindrodendrum hubeiense TaxID=595255 RepID=A0A9P5H286_9HYPO|nr:hypothetical protein G7Z17_g12819 [Cylindrodendrum hubeiense]